MQYPCQKTFSNSISTSKKLFDTLTTNFPDRNRAEIESKKSGSVKKVMASVSSMSKLFHVP